MLKPSFKNIILFIFLKYLFFWIFMMFKNDIYTLIEINEIHNGQDLFYYLWLFGTSPTAYALLFSVPIYYSFRIKKSIFFLLIIPVIFIVEYKLYTYLDSPGDLWNGFFNALISLALFISFYFKAIREVIMKPLF